jgi:type IV pilus assembly protein PilQ
MICEINFLAITRPFWLLLLLLGASGVNGAQLLKVKTNNIANGQFGVELVFDSPVNEIKDRLEYQPDQLVIAIPRSSSALALNPLPINSTTAKELKTESIDDQLVITIALNNLYPYTITKQDSRVIVQIGSPNRLAQAISVVSDPEEGARGAEQSGTSFAASESNGLSDPLTPDSTQKGMITAPAKMINTLRGVDFRRSKDGAGQLMIDLENASIAADIKRRDQSIEVEFLNTSVLDELIYVMDVNDFGTPVTSAEVFKDENKVRLEVAVDGNFDFRYDQTDNLFVLEVNRVAEVEVTETAETVYQGKPISLNFQDIPVRTVLQLIADFNKLNLVTTDSVQGNITLRLDDVPWEQALDLVLKVKGLGKQLENNVLLVAPASELSEQERQTLESSQKVAELAALYSEYVAINYAKAEDLASLLKSKDTSMLSSRGTVAVDTRTNTLLLRDTEESIASIKKMLGVLDVPVKQVVIEARMVTVSEDVSDELGVDWGFTYGDSDSTFSTSGSLDGIDGWKDGDSDSDDRLNVNLPSGTSTAGSIAFQIANLGDSGILDLELTALEEESKGEVIASPRLTTSNQHEAYIEQGTEIPYEESTSSGATSTSFEKAVISLTVTPQITPDNRVILDLNITQDSQGETYDSGVAIDTQEISTQVLVNDGETIVLGGIYQQTIIESVSKVPYLGDIPYLGWLFRSTSNTNEKTELLIFVTPKIVLDSL